MPSKLYDAKQEYETPLGPKMRAWLEDSFTRALSTQGFCTAWETRFTNVEVALRYCEWRREWENYYFECRQKNRS